MNGLLGIELRFLKQPTVNDVSFKSSVYQTWERFYSNFTVIYTKTKTWKAYGCGVYHTSKPDRTVHFIVDVKKQSISTKVETLEKLSSYGKEVPQTTVTRKYICKGGWQVSKTGTFIAGRKPKSWYVTSEFSDFVGKENMPYLNYKQKVALWKFHREGEGRAKDVAKLVIGYSSPKAIKAITDMRYSTHWGESNVPSLIWVARLECATGVSDSVFNILHRRHRETYKWLTPQTYAAFVKHDTSEALIELVTFRRYNKEIKWPTLPLKAITSTRGAEEAHLDDQLLVAEKLLKGAKQFKKRETLSFTYEGEEWILKTPSCSQEVVQWGSEHRHCIAGYVKSHLKNTLIFGVWKGGERIYAVMVTSRLENGPVVQHGHFQGKFNVSAPKGLKEEALKAISGGQLLYKVFPNTLEDEYYAQDDDEFLI